MRYLLRRYGNFNGFDIPGVIKNLKDSIGSEIQLESRYKSIWEINGVIVVQGYNRLNSREFVKGILDVRVKNMDKLLYVPGPFNPYDFPVLYYLGIDLLDDSFIRLRGDVNCIIPTGFTKMENCVQWNNSLLSRIIEEVKASLKNGNFRELVEFYSITSFAREILRILDMENYDQIKKFIDHIPREIKAGSLESMYRPELVEYRERVKVLEQTADYLLLIPCSAVKPYSISKSHRVLHSHIGKFLNNIQEVIVTSPLGLVPREIEAFYPPAYYDIPVTGFWFEDERKMLLEISKGFFANKRYKKVFYILPEGEDVILDLFQNKIGIKGKLNSENSIQLAKLLSTEGISPGSHKKYLEMVNIINYFYDIKVDHSKLIIKNEGNRKLIYYDNKEFMKLTSSGPKPLIGLAEFLYENRKRVIEIGEEVKSSNIFVPIVKNISEDVKPGDQVVVVSNGKILGYGISTISQSDLDNIKRGIAISEFSRFH